MALFLIPVGGSCCCCCCPWECSGSEDGGDKVEEGAEGIEEGEGDGEEAPPAAALADAARASPLRISVVSSEVDRARIQGAAWQSGQEGITVAVASAAVGGGGGAGAEAEAFEVGLSSAAEAASQEEGERGRRAAAPAPAVTAATVAAAAEERERELGPRAAAAGRAAAPLPTPLLLARPDCEDNRRAASAAGGALNAEELPAAVLRGVPAADGNAASGRGPTPLLAGKEEDGKVEVDDDAPIAAAARQAKPTCALRSGEQRRGAR